ncbi:MAG TPA: hypothetical protein VFK52_08260 [Nocardioidaceae bacterium]|nr:hypothetical protein [Nocardioidaceae bacterium]
MTHPEPDDGPEEAPEPQSSALRQRLRVVRNRLDNLEVRRARKMMRHLRENPVDVLAIGDSMWAFTAPYDEDQRHLAAMITHDLGSDVSMYGVVGAGYNAGLIDAYLGLAERAGYRPLLIVPLTVRLVTVAWAEHPNYSYRAAAAAISRMPGDIPLARIRKAVKPATARDFEAYDTIEITAFGETAPIGDFRRRLKQPERFGLDAAGREKLLYAFHHGEVVPDDSPYLELVRRLGRRVAGMGGRVVLYETAVPVVRGEELHGPVFRTQTLENQGRVRDAFQEGFGDAVEVLRTGAIFQTEEFIDPEDASEHLNALGRRRLSQLIVDATKRAL